MHPALLDALKDHPTAAIQHLEQQAGQRITVVEERMTQELSRLDKLIAAAREALVPELKQEPVQEKTPEKALEKDQEVKIERGHGFGIGR